MANFYKKPAVLYTVNLGTSRPSHLEVGDLITATGTAAGTGDAKYISATRDYANVEYPFPQVHDASHMYQEPGVIAWRLSDGDELILTSADVTKIGASHLTELDDFDVTLGLKIYRYAV